jgi:hypothetical protein
MFPDSMSPREVEQLINKNYPTALLSKDGVVPLKKYPGVSLQYYLGDSNIATLVHPIIH